MILHLFLTFCKFSLLCFGGGYMLIPLLTAEFVGDGKLLSPERFGNLVSISQLTPGPVGINAATYAGFLESGFWGALAATLGLVFPTLFLAGAAISFINANKEKLWLKSLLYGARLGAAVLIIYAVLIFAGMSVFTKPVADFFRAGCANPEISGTGTFIAATAFFLTLKYKLKTTYIILISGILGALLVPIAG